MHSFPHLSSNGSIQTSQSKGSSKSANAGTQESVNSLASGFLSVSASVSVESAKLSRFLTYSHIILVLGIFALNLTIPWMRYGMTSEAWPTCKQLDEEFCTHGELCKHRMLQFTLTLFNTIIFASFLLIVYLRTSRTSLYLSRVRLYFTVQWLCMQSEGITMMVEFCSEGDNDRGRIGHLGFGVFFVLFVIGILLLQYNLIVRIRAMEHEMGYVHYGKVLTIIFYGELGGSFFAAFWTFLYGAGVPLSELVRSLTLYGSCLVLFVLLTSFLVLACVAFKVPVEVLETGKQYELTKREQGILEYALQVSIRTLFWVRACGITTMASVLGVMVSVLTYKHIYWISLVMKVVMLADCSTNSMCVLLTSGLFGKPWSPCEDEHDRESTNSTWKGTSDHDWDARVEDLAARSLSLEALLKFWQKLGNECMKHFDPAKHRTADVVRMAMIPMSARTCGSPCALSMVLMDNNRCLADRMVSHAWDNLFCHLVAAIVADALDIGSYESIVPRLKPNKIQGLIAELERKDLLRIRYWICAFCVNQHRSICTEISARDRDPVTGKLHPKCSCGESQIRNDTPPLRTDGESIECEMNKFDDMIVYLGAHKSGFRHVIVVDCDFLLFERAWCIAEIYRANRSGFNQKLRFHSSDSVKKHSSKLKQLSVQSMDAYRLEDKIAILSKINDINTFNKDLRRMICDQHTGLLRQWMDASGDYTFVGQATLIIRSHSSRSMSSWGSTSKSSGKIARQTSPSCGTYSSSSSKGYSSGTTVDIEPIPASKSMKGCTFERWRISL